MLGLYVFLRIHDFPFSIILVLFAILLMPRFAFSLPPAHALAFIFFYLRLFESLLSLLVFIYIYYINKNMCITVYSRAESTMETFSRITRQLQNHSS